MTRNAEEINTALTVLAEFAGSPTRAAKALEETMPDVTAQALSRWKNDTHAEQYRRIEERYGQEMEVRAVLRARQIVDRASDIESELMERARNATDPKDVAANLKAVGDVKAKNVNAVLQFTGRPTSPKDQGGSDVVKLFQSMVDKGWLKMAAGVELEPPKSG